MFTCSLDPAFSANEISGVVRNGTTGEVAANEEVILLRVDHGMNEESRARTNARGAFTLSLPRPGASYVVRVVHQHVNYDQRCEASADLVVKVFDAASDIRSVTGSIEILRAGTNGRFLHVSDLYEINNDSNPPVTQTGEHTFDVYLPGGAQIDSVMAAGPEKIRVMIAAAPVPGDPGHYAVDFPLRPGATKFAFNYDLPYQGHAAFRTRHAYPLQQFAVMIPASMVFTAGPGSFETLPTGEEKYRVEAVNRVAAGAGPQFAISGTGELPPLGNEANVPKATRSSADEGVSLPPLAPRNLRVANDQTSGQVPVLIVLTAFFVLASVLMVVRGRHEGKRVTRPAVGGTPPARRSGQRSAAQARAIRLRSVPR